MHKQANLPHSSVRCTAPLSRTLSRALRAAALAVAASATATAHAQPMHVSGRQLLDACGEPFVVRGVEQILGKELPPGNDWMGLIEQIEVSGVNAVRILPGVTTLSVQDVDNVLTFIGQHNMVAYLAPLNGGNDWLARSDVKAMLAKHEGYLIIDAYGEPQFDDVDRWHSEAVAALQEVRALGYKVPLTVTANQFGRDLPSILQQGSDFIAADPLHNVMLGWQAYWGQGGYYQDHYGMSYGDAINAIVASGLPIQLGLDHITDLPSEEADFGQLMTGAAAHAIGWLWWDWFNPYGNENNLSTDGTANHLSATGQIVVNSHAASVANTAHNTCSGQAAPATPPAVVIPPTVVIPPAVVIPPPVVSAPLVVSAPAIVSINAGGTADGAFMADADVTGGNVAPQRNVAIDSSLVTAPAPASVYQTERWGAMRYRIPGFAPRTKHSVQLHFAELVFASAGQRLFNVNVNGRRVLTDFDVFGAAGAKNRAVMRSFDATANARGEIVIDFQVGSADQPTINGIVVK
jgi:hypothetical protein